MPTLRALGMIGVLGGLTYSAAGIRLLVLGVPEDRFTDVLGVAWAASWVAAGWAMLQLRVTGESRLARGVSALLLLGFCMAAVWGCYRLIDPVAADRSPVAAAPAVVILGMLGTGILAPRAGVWSGWRGHLPLLIGVVYVASVAASVSTGRSTLGYAFSLAGLGYAALGQLIAQGGASLAAARTATPPPRG